MTDKPLKQFDYVDVARNQNEYDTFIKTTDLKARLMRLPFVPVEDADKIVDSDKLYLVLAKENWDELLLELEAKKP